MPYTQKWGISRNTFQSPLNNDEIYKADGSRDYNAESDVRIAATNKKHFPKEEDNPATTIISENNNDSNSDEDIIEQNNDKANTYYEGAYYKGASGRHGAEFNEEMKKRGFNVGGPELATFSEKELNKAAKAAEIKTSLDMIKGGETWENSKFNDTPDEGFDSSGNASITKKENGGYVFGSEDLGDNYSPETKVSNFANRGSLDDTQKALGIGGFAPGFVGPVLDTINAGISGARSISSGITGDTKEAKKHGINMFKNALYAAGPIGDAFALNKLSKISKYHQGKNLHYATTSKRGAKRNIMSNIESKYQNVKRGLSSWFIGKNKNTLLGKNINKLFGKNNTAVGEVVSTVASGKTIVKDPVGIFGGS